jgi:mono/diheme cytochrome c family protein
MIHVIRSLIPACDGDASAFQEAQMTRTLVLLLSTALLALFSLACRSDGVRADGPETARAAGAPPPATPRLLQLGQRTYQKECAACHGERGDGEGEAAYLLYPRPRDFTSGQFRLISTWDAIPTDEDLFRAISRGMPGSAMPSWSHLPEETRWALVHHVKTFSRFPFDLEPDREPEIFGSGGAGVIRLPPEPAYTPAAQARARELYVKGCAPCHGATGKGDGQQEQRDSRGHPTQPRDLTAGMFKGSPDPAEVYRRIVGGLPGSPMPQSGYLHGEDGWHLVHFVLSLSNEAQRARSELRRVQIDVPRVMRLPEHPDSTIWRTATPVDVALMPLWWRTDRPEHVTVRALHDGKALAILLVWADSTHDTAAFRPQDFADAAAVQIALDRDPPFFAMGDRAGRVNIWMWNADRHAGLDRIDRDVGDVYPNAGIDTYPHLQRSPLDQPMRRASTVESEPTFITGWGAGNVMSDRGARTAEDLTARGFGTLRARPGADREVVAVGTHTIGSYRVQFTRRLDPGGRDAAVLAPGGRVPVAFAVWDGSAGDRDGRKSVTAWQEMIIQR